MSNHVEFFDYSLNVKNAIRDKAITLLYELGGEVRSRTQRNGDNRRKTGQTSGSYGYKVDDGQLAAHIGSNFENAIWEEFGTGRFAQETGHSGRSGWWVYVKGGNPSAKRTSSKGKSYKSKDEAKRAVAILRSKGLEAYYTEGKKANRPLYRAFESIKPYAESRAREVFGGMSD